ncbi:hypothetical protein SAMN05444410_11428 [Hydrobacter penzbergensis]|uniref:Uncharacterized protein n=1 Tax=Hydrobacter penzbergensis TaxID=1235997 RepID=A0A8X8IHV6_9BACT|nr:hypothetical protein [Hydrobacter penzbergensis]SDX35922.1 hypothetical protein SAMN05444410_11428 [Hydrobacter penzbergensis]
MYQQFWIKYIPVIRILFKRTAVGDQILDLNRVDFEHAGMTRKAGYKFDIELVNGRVSNHIGGMPLAAELAAILLEDPAVQMLLTEHDFVISLNTRYQLSIKRIQVAT